MNLHARQSVVLLIEGDDDSTTQCRSLIEGLGAICHPVRTLEDAEQILRQNAPEVVVVDYALPDGSGIDLIALLRQSMEHRTTPIILLTGDIDPHELERAVMMGIYAFLAKPFSPQEFTKLVNAAIAEEAGRVRNDRG
jgi:two-component system, OmpR family, phosphate regulon response regulator PhoB